MQDFQYELSDNSSNVRAIAGAIAMQLRGAPLLSRLLPEVSERSRIFADGEVINGIIEVPHRSRRPRFATGARLARRSPGLLPALLLF